MNNSWERQFEREHRRVTGQRTQVVYRGSGWWRVYVSGKFGKKKMGSYRESALKFKLEQLSQQDSAT